jgi:hypothetical protein
MYELWNIATIRWSAGILLLTNWKLTIRKKWSQLSHQVVLFLIFICYWCFWQGILCDIPWMFIIPPSNSCHKIQQLLILFFVGGRHVVHLLSFLYYIFPLVCLSSVPCTQCCLFLWIVLSWLPFGFCLFYIVANSPRQRKLLFVWFCVNIHYINNMIKGYEK